MKKYIYSTIAFLALFAGIQFAFGNVLTTQPSGGATEFKEYSFFASSTETYFATTTSATSTDIDAFFDANGQYDNGAFNIAGARQVDLYFQRGDTVGTGNTGTTTFKIQVTADGSTWHDYGQLEEITTTTTADGYFTRVSSPNAGASDTNDHTATSTAIYRMDDTNFKAIRCIVVEEVDGEHSCRAAATW